MPAGGGLSSDMFAQIKAARSSQGDGGGDDDNARHPSPQPGAVNPLAAMLKARSKQPPPQQGGPSPPTDGGGKPTTSTTKPPPAPLCKTGDGPFSYDESSRAFLFFQRDDGPDAFVPELVPDRYGNVDVDVAVPLAPCVYRLLDLTLLKKQPVQLDECLLKLGILRCLQREVAAMNRFLKYRDYHMSLEEDELNKIRAMELLSKCGISQKASELVLKRAAAVADRIKRTEDRSESQHGDGDDAKERNQYKIPQIRVDGLDDMLAAIEGECPELVAARKEIERDQVVSFYPGLGELYSPGSTLVCFPEGLEGSPLGCTCIQSWYTQELNQATKQVRRRFVLVIEFVVSVGQELVFVAATDGALLFVCCYYYTALYCTAGAVRQKAGYCGFRLCPKRISISLRKSVDIQFRNLTRRFSCFSQFIPSSKMRRGPCRSGACATAS